MPWLEHPGAVRRASSPHASAPTAAVTPPPSNCTLPQGGKAGALRVGNHTVKASYEALPKPLLLIDKVTLAGGEGGEDGVDGQLALDDMEAVAAEEDGDGGGSGGPYPDGSDEEEAAILARADRQAQAQQQPRTVYVVRGVVRHRWLADDRPQPIIMAAAGGSGGAGASAAGGKR